MTYDDFLERELLAPLGMATARVALEDRSRLATGYRIVDGRPVEDPYRTISVPAAGSVHASGTDLAALLVALSTQTGVLSHASYVEQVAQGDGAIPWVGLGCFLDCIAGETVVSHDGGWPGFVTSVQWVPGRRLGVAVCGNAFDLTPRSVADGIITALLGPGDPQPSIDGDDVRRFAGSFRPPADLSTSWRFRDEHGGELTVAVEGDGLRASTPVGPLRDGVSLRRIGESTFTGEFQRRGALVRAWLSFEPDGVLRARLPHPEVLARAPRPLRTPRLQSRLFHELGLRRGRIAERRGRAWDDRA
jgi:hypothetical protein